MLLDDTQEANKQHCARITSFTKLEVEFAKMTNRIKQSLQNNNINAGSLAEQLCTISAVRMKRVPFFDDDEAFEKVTTIDELWKRLRKFWNMYDYDILIMVVEIAECAEAQKILDDFLSTIDPSAIKDVDLVLHYKEYKEEGIMRPQLRVKVNVERCTVDVEKKVKDIVSTKLDVKRYSLHLISVKNGCIELSYQISKALMSYLLHFKVTGSVMVDFAAFNITSLQVDDMMLTVPPDITDVVSIACGQVCWYNILCMY